MFSEDFLSIHEIKTVSIGVNNDQKHIIAYFDRAVIGRAVVVCDGDPKPESPSQPKKRRRLLLLPIGLPTCLCNQ